MNRLFFGLVLIFVSEYVYAERPVRLFMDSEECILKEVGYVILNDPLIIPGKRWGSGSMSGCKVEIAKKQFDQQFKFCFLSGISITGGSGGSCAASLYDRENLYRFETSPAGKSPDLSCNFTCIKN